MRLTPIIYIIETSYGALGLIALFCIGASFFTLKGETLIITIVLSLALLIAAFFVKLNLINFYLKSCKYPYEFLSVLEQLKLTKDVQINWSKNLINGPNKSQSLTQSFLDDNNLATEIGEKKNNLPVALIMIGISIVGLIYLSKEFSFQDKPIIFVSLLLFLITSIYLWTEGKKQLSDSEPILIFKDEGLRLNENVYQWKNIKNWVHKGGGENSSSEMIITYGTSNSQDIEIKADLNKINIDRIDFMLLLTHFKAKYG